MAREVDEHLIYLPRSQFFELWLEHSKKARNDRLFEYLTIRFELQDATEDSVRNFKRNITRNCARLEELWIKAGKNSERFQKSPAGINWLNGEDIKLSFSCYTQSSTPSLQLETSSGPGRPMTHFEQASFKTKKRRVDDLIRSRDANELAVAAQVSTRISGKRDVSTVIKHINENPEKAKEIKQLLLVSNPQRRLTNEEALAYYIDAKCTSYSYKKTRQWALKAGHDVYPPYGSVVTAKNACYPSKSSIFTDEIRAEIKLQAILDKTCERLISVQSEVVESLHSSSLTLISKWGCDGSSGYSTYKQKFTNPNDTDEFLFVYSFVPLRLHDGKNIIWQNPRPSSTMYCRPIRFIFTKESTEFTVTETNKVLEEVNQLIPTVCEVNTKEVTIVHEMLLTMIDGKVCNALTETKSSLRCYLCQLTTQNLNDENKEYTIIDPDKVRFGLSTLHASMRCASMRWPVLRNQISYENKT